MKNVNFFKFSQIILRANLVYESDMKLGVLYCPAVLRQQYPEHIVTLRALDIHGSDFTS